MNNNDLKSCSAEYSGLPVELIAKLEKPGNPADFLTMDDAQKLSAFIRGQRELINALRFRMSGLEIENQNLKRVLEETETERYEALEQNERLRGGLIECSSILDGAAHGRIGILAATCKIHSIVDLSGSEQPPSALAALKAKWQSEAASEVMMILLRGYIFHQPKWFPHFREEVRSKFMRAQEVCDANR